jgi:Ca2+-binding RTX toxin-like protein
MARPVPARAARSPRAPLLEPLEFRRLCSATVTELYTGFYEVQANPGNNTIDISVSMANETFTLDSTTYYGVQYIAVYAGDGADTISLVTNDGPGWIGATVDAGGGDDVVTLNFDGGVWAGNGDDTLNLADSFRGEAHGDAGADTINVSGECIDPEIIGGDGDDVIDASGNHYGVVIQGGAGDDTIYGSAYADEIYAGEGDDLLRGNGGNDIFYTADSTGTDTVWGGDGGDTLYGDANDLVADASVETVHTS